MKGAGDELAKIAPGARQEPAGQPARGAAGAAPRVPGADRRGGDRVQPDLPGRHRGLSERWPAPATASERQNRLAPYLLVAPGILWLSLSSSCRSSPWSRRRWPAPTAPGMTPTAERPRRLRRPVPPLVRATRSPRRSWPLALGYPLAYVIAFRGGRLKNLLLGLVVLRSSPRSWSAPSPGRRSSTTAAGGVAAAAAAPAGARAAGCSTRPWRCSAGSRTTSCRS